MPAAILSKEQLSAIHERAVAGESLPALAREYGVHYTNLWKRLVRNHGFQPESHWMATYTPPTDAGEIGYLAGLFDGEGSVFPHPAGRHGWQVKISMTDEATMRWIHSFGGTMYRTVPAPPRKPFWCWSLGRYRDVPVFLETVLPHLIVKRERAITCIAYYRDSPPPKIGRPVNPSNRRT